MERKLILVLLMVVTFSWIVYAEDNLIGNGDFSAGIGKWIGDRKIETIDGNQVAVIEAGSNTKKFQQSFNGRGLKAVEITLRYKASEDYKGKGFQLQIFREGADMDDWTFRNVTFDKLKSGETKSDWKTLKWTFNKFKRDGYYSLKIEAQPGQGKLYFDDILVVAK
jgi:hypothetical protein